MELYKNETSDFLLLIRFLYKNGKKIIMTTAATTVLAIIITFFIPVKYRSTAVVYANFNNDAEKNITSPQFGFELQTDHLMQILDSQTMKDSLTRIFNLVEYYELDSVNDSRWAFKLNKKINKDIKFNRTRFLSVEISALMKDPKMSADVVNKILDIANKMRNQILKQDIENMLSEIRQQLTERNKRFKVAFDSLNAQSVSAKDTAIYAYNRRNLRYEEALTQELKMKIEQLENAAQKTIPGLFVVDKGKPSLRRDYPSYMENMILGFLVGLMGSLLFFAFKEKYVQIKDKITAP